MNFAFLSSCLAFFSVYLCTGQTISGKIVAAATGEPVAFAAIQYGANEGTISNEEGYFMFQVPATEAGEVTVSCMGYRSSNILISRLNKPVNIIELEESVVVLREVFLTNKDPDANEIIQQVRERLSQNYSALLVQHQFFFRETEYIDFGRLGLKINKASHVPKAVVKGTNAELDSLVKVVKDNRTVHFKDYLGNIAVIDKDSSFLKVEKATSLIDTKKDFSIEKIQEKAQRIVLQYLDTTKTYKLKTGIIKIEDSLQLDEESGKEDAGIEYEVPQMKSETHNLLNTAGFYEESLLSLIIDPSYYDYRFDRATYLEDALIYVIDFTPSRGKAKYAGRLYIHAKDYALLKVDYQYSKGKRGKKVNLKLLLGIKYVQNVRRGTILFKKGMDGIYQPSYIQQTEGSYFYVNRPLKFIENSPQKNKVAFNFMLEGNSRNKEELLLTSSKRLGLDSFKEKEEAKKIAVIQLSKYDETIWEDSKILQPLEEMRQFNAME